MKTEFVDSELEVIRFAEKDIIMTSSHCGEADTHGDPDPDPGEVEDLN